MRVGAQRLVQICAEELSRHGVRSNAIAPAARTRLTEATPGLGEVVKAPDDTSQFDLWDPANVSPFVAYLATADCPFNGEAFLVQGGVVQRFQPWWLSEKIDKATAGPWPSSRPRARSSFPAEATVTRGGVCGRRGGNPTLGGLARSSPFVAADALISHTSRGHTPQNW